jgi:hypothetical protein
LPPILDHVPRFDRARSAHPRLPGQIVEEYPRNERGWDNRGVMCGRMKCALIRAS